MNTLKRIYHTVLGWFPENKPSRIAAGLFFIGLLAIIGKALGLINLPWFAITAPFWIPVCLVAGFVIGILIVYASSVVIALVATWIDEKRKNKK